MKANFYGTKFYSTFHQLKQRCNNPRNPNYPNYGGRGIRNLWASFDEFKEDMYPSFCLHEKLYGGRQTTIERIDNDGPYSKENCRWATQKEQACNQQRSKKVQFTLNGDRRTLSSWANSLGLNQNTLRTRVYMYGWPEGLYWRPKISR